MSFIIRAALVIGALSYLAIGREQPGIAPARTIAVPTLADAWEALPAAARERVVQDGTAEIGRRIAGAAMASRDTLAEADRQPAWRGVASR